MRRPSWGCLTCGVLLSLAIGCAHHDNGQTALEEAEPTGPKITRIAPGPDAQKLITEALINAEPGEVIELAEGTFDLEGTLSVEDKTDLTIRGAGIDKTILSFAKMGAGTGGEGLKISGARAPEATPQSQANLTPGADPNAPPPVAADVALPEDTGVRDNFVLEDFTIENSKADLIKVEGARGVTFRRVKAQWTGGPKTSNGAYALYPVLCKDVLIEDCVAIGSSDAGVYVGQSENIIVRRCRAEQNVAGIEIENSIGADVYDCVATGNTGGLLVFTLPGLPVKTGRHCRLFNNQVYGNNLDNFGAEGSIVATIPAGTGMIVMANDQVEVFNNTIKDNGTFGLAVISYLTTQRAFNDPKYDPYVEGIYVHDNTFEKNGDSPTGEIGQMAGSALGGKVPSIVFDGFHNPDRADADGNIPAEFRVFLKNNNGADFANLDAPSFVKGQVPNISQDAAVYEGELPPLSAIAIEGSE